MIPQLAFNVGDTVAADDSPYAMKVIWVGVASVICEWLDDSGQPHEQEYLKTVVRYL